MKKVLFVATVVRLHINMFHKPYIKWFHDQGWQVDVVANNDYENKEDCIIPYCDSFFDLPFERNPFKISNILVLKQLRKIINANHYDIIHCHTPMGSVITRLVSKKTQKRGTKIVYTVHGFHFYSGAPLLNWGLYFPIEWLLSFRTDLLITMNQEDFLRAKKLHAKQVEFVNGVGLDLDKFIQISKSEKSAVRNSLNLEEQDIFAISVAQLIKRKNHIILIEAVSRLNNPHFHLFICGDGMQQEELTKRVKELGIDNQVHFLGFRKDIQKLCSAADLFLFASLQEGLPVALMEAMACGLPIIASNIRGNVDLIDQGKGGYLVNPKDVNGFVEGIEALLGDEYNISLMKDYNLRKIKNYGINSVLNDMSNLYRSLM